MVIALKGPVMFTPLLTSGSPLTSLITGGAERLVNKALPETSAAYSYLGVAATVESIARTYARFAASVGLREAREWLRAEDPEAQGVHPSLVELFNEEAPRWSKNIRRAYGMDVQFELSLLDQIPSGSLVMSAGIHHASLEPCYTIWEELPQVRPVPDRGNYLTSNFSKKSGLGALLAGAGFVFVDRENTGGQRQFIKRLEGIMAEHGLWPLFFITGGRPPVAFEKDGTPAIPGLFAKAVDPERPEIYIASGAMTSAWIIARKRKETVYVPLFVTEGEHLVKPKIARKSPFIEPVTRRKTVTHRAVEVLEVTRKTMIRGLEKEIVGIFKKKTGIEDYLARTVEEWGEIHGMPQAAASFTEQAAAEEKLFVVADRIRSLHPELTLNNLGKVLPGIGTILPLPFLHSRDYPLRNAAQAGLLTLLSDPQPEKLDATLGAVSSLVSAAEYRLW